MSVRNRIAAAVVSVGALGIAGPVAASSAATVPVTVGAKAAAPVVSTGNNAAYAALTTGQQAAQAGLATGAQAAIGGWQVDSYLCAGYGRLVIKLVANDIDSESEFVYQPGTENMSFGYAGHAIV